MRLRRNARRKTLRHIVNQPLVVLTPQPPSPSLLSLPPPFFPPSPPSLSLSPSPSLPADAVYDSVAQVLMSRSNGLMSQYQQLISHDAQVSLSLSPHSSLHTMEDIVTSA